MNRYKNTLLLLGRICKSMPFITVFSLTMPFISGLITVYIYNAQVSLINIMAGNLSEFSWLGIIKLSAVPLIIYLLFSIIQLLMNMIKNINAQKLKARATDMLQGEMIDLCRIIDYEEFSNDTFCDKFQRANAILGDDVVELINSLISSISIFSSILSLVLLAVTNHYYVIALVVTVMIFINLAIKFYTEVRVVRLGRAITYDGRIGDYMFKTLHRSDMLREARIYNCIDYFTDLWATKIKKQNKVRYNARRTEIKTGIIVTFIQTTAILFILLYFIKEMKTSSNVTVGLMSVLIIGILQSSYKILTLSWPLGQFYVKSARLYDLNEVLRLKDSYKIKRRERTEEEILPVMIKGVTFSYPNNKKNALNGIDLTIKKNEKIAIVGGNGAGKSTLIKLLLGIYTPTEGTIYWGNEPITPDKISVVYQNYIKYELSLRENIAFGNLKHLDDDNKILSVIQDCGLIELYNELGGLDVKLGRIYEGGRELSGGQWQRIAIARALFSDSCFIIFDEPTAAIDPNAELEIYKMLIDLCSDKTAIFISHRLGWAKNADRIIVLGEGKVVENGTHEELIQKNGVYAGMYNLQASWYVGNSMDYIKA